MDSQAEAARAKEQAVRQETNKQLELFRQKQSLASKTASVSFTDKSNEAIEDNDTDWTTSKKRKRVKQKESVRAVKLPRSSEMLSKSEMNNDAPQEEELPAPIMAKSSDGKGSVANKQGVSLVGYGSDEDSD